MTGRGAALMLGALFLLIAVPTARALVREPPVVAHIASRREGPSLLDGVSWRGFGFK
jgi:hypothetical protein